MIELKRLPARDVSDHTDIRETLKNLGSPKALRGGSIFMNGRFYPHTKM